MTHAHSLFTHLRASLLAVTAALSAACTFVVEDDEERAWQRCYDQYDLCLDAADEDKATVLGCGEQLEICASANEEAAASGGDSQHSGDGPHDGDGDGAGDGPGDAPDGSGGGEAPAPDVCVALHQTCLAGADDLADVLACESLFDHCADPGECAEPCAHACPQAALDACLADYAGCVGAADKDYEVEACDLVFDGCLAEAGGAECLPADDAHVDACLAEHALCTACAASEAELAACKDVFDACVSPPM